MKNFVSVLITFLIITGCATQGTINKPFKKAVLAGMVYDKDNNVVANAAIFLDEVLKGYTDINGRFYLHDTSSGTYKIHVEKKDYETLEKEFDFINRSQVLHLTVISSRQLLDLSQEAMKQRNWKLANQYLDRAEAILTDDVEIAYERALIHYMRHQYSEAESLLLSLLVQYDEVPYIYLLLADIYQYHYEDLDKARQHLAKYLEYRADSEVESRLKEL